MSVDKEIQEHPFIPLNLQWFADDGDKTEEPTAKKLSDARNDGKVAKSRELASAGGLIALFLILRVFVGSIGMNLMHLFPTFYGLIPDFMKENRYEISGRSVGFLLQEALLTVIRMCLPFFIIGLFTTFAVNYLQVRWMFTTKPLQPKLSNLNPMNGLKRIFSKNSLVELVKSIAKVILIAAIAYSSLRQNINDIMLLYDMAIINVIALMGSLIINTGLKISFAMLVVGIADFIYQKWKFHEDMKMSKQEVKDEYKNAEGDPEIKGKQRARMREASQRRMMQDVPKADVVITNPTHLAVALKYDAEVSQAPIVLAKGADYLAMQIREKAKEAKVEIVENKPLARMLYANVEVGEEIPPELYQTVAEILASVYRMNNRI